MQRKWKMCFKEKRGAFVHVTSKFWSARGIIKITWSIKQYQTVHQLRILVMWKHSQPSLKNRFYFLMDCSDSGAQLWTIFFPEDELFYCSKRPTVSHRQWETHEQYLKNYCSLSIKIYWIYVRIVSINHFHPPQFFLRDLGAKLHLNLFI